MTSAKQFGQNLLACGKCATMSKHDLVAAYKQVPCTVKDFRLQGFMWLGRYFVETRQVFGAKTSVCNFGIVGETLKLLALCESVIPPYLVLRQVDDVPLCAPNGSGLCEDFSATYKNLCADLNVKLAPDCPLSDKAFTNQVRGKVLGVIFDSTDMTWRLSDAKINKAKKSVKLIFDSATCSLRDFQKLLGRLNDICQMCEFMKVFKQPLNKTLSGIPSDASKDLRLTLSKEARTDLMIWAGFLHSDLKWLPISVLYESPPLWCREFVSDAAGLPESSDFRTSPGCGNVGFSEDGTIIFAYQLTWPKNFIMHCTDEKGVRFGDKSTTLEMIGLLLPLLLVPELFINLHVIMKVDCFGTVCGMHNRTAKGDNSASIFIRAAYLIAAYLGCTIHTEHLPRLSNWGAETTDRLSRGSTTTRQDRKLVSSFTNRPIPGPLESWLRSPSLDWNLPFKLLNHVQDLV